MPGGGRLEVALRRRGVDLVLGVRDEGRGVERRAAPHLRALPFGAPMGTGLGLAIVFRIVREHGGDISVHSAPDKGTQVEVRLPLVPVALPA